MSAVPLVPLPSPSFRVGVTGTRVLPEDAGPLRAALAAVLRQVAIGTALLVAKAQEAGVYAPGPPRLRMISPLAEGADRLVAEVALEFGYTLEAPLPFARAEYAHDFPDPAPFDTLLHQAGPRVLELDGGRQADESHSYEAVGRLVVRNCDLLIALWDGKPGKGRGGTADIVNYCSRVGPPIWWLRPDGTQPPAWLSDSLDMRALDSLPTGPDATVKLDAYLTTTILPPQHIPKHTHSTIGRAARHVHGVGHWAWSYVRRRQVVPVTALSAFLAEQRLPPRPIWNLYKAVIRRVAAAQSSPWSEPPDSPAETWQYWKRIYQPVDALAVAYADRYRSSYMLVFMMAAVALVGAVLGVGLHHIASVTATIEVVMLVSIGGLVWMNEVHDWNDRLIGYRLLAELCRKQQALSLLGWSLPAAEIAEMGPWRQMDAPQPGDWIGWYFNAMLRGAPLPSGHLDPEALNSVKAVIQANLIGGQADYHAAVKANSERAARRLGLWGEALFLVTIVCILIKLPLLVYDPYPWLTVTLGLSAAMLPAVSAAFIGIRFYAELEILAARSAHMHQTMLRAEARLARLKMDYPLASQDLGAEVLHLAEQMLLDLKGWAELFKVKVVEAG